MIDRSATKDSALSDSSSALPARQDQWQPIETAPKDWTKILVWSEALREPTIAWWMGPRDMSEVSLEGWGPWGDSEGRWCLNDDEQPTHWMPLPEPPALAALLDPAPPETKAEELDQARGGTKGNP